MLDEETPVSAVATVPSPGLVEFSVEAAVAEGMGHIRRASAVLHTKSEDAQPAAHDMAALLAAHTLRVDGEEMRTHFDQHGVQYGPAFTGLGAALIKDGTADGTASSVLAEVALPPSIRSQLNSYGIHPALLDACFQAIAAHPDVQAALSGGLMLPLGVRRLRAFGSARNACYCYIRDTKTGRPASRPTSTCSMSRARCCWPSRDCCWAPGPPSRAIAAGCSTSDC